MNLEQAIQTALEYETQIHELDKEAADKVRDPSGRRTLQLLRDDELSHIQYLEHQLETWKTSGRLDPGELQTRFPSAADLAPKLKQVKHKLDVREGNRERDILEKALRAEVETSAFYEKMVRELPEEEGRLFTSFLKII